MRGQKKKLLDQKINDQANGDQQRRATGDEMGLKRESRPWRDEMEEEGLRKFFFPFAADKIFLFLGFLFIFFPSSLPRWRRLLQVRKGVQEVDLQPVRGLAGAKKFMFRVVHR